VAEVCARGGGIAETSRAESTNRGRTTRTEYEYHSPGRETRMPTRIACFVALRAAHFSGPVTGVIAVRMRPMARKGEAEGEARVREMAHVRNLCSLVQPVVRNGKFFLSKGRDLVFIWCNLNCVCGAISAPR